MANNVINEVTLHDVKSDQVRLLIGSQESAVDFCVLLPLSKHFWPGSVGKDHRTFFPGTQLEEAVKTWGTKWNAYGGPQAKQVGKDYVLTFQTAWDTPRGWICALFNSVKCDITVRWLSEGSERGWEEHFCYHGALGPKWHKEEIRPETMTHGRLHKLLWGVESFEESGAS